MTTPPVISVIVANYNGTATVLAALQSALGQTLGDIQVVVADDGSTDDSPARIRTLAATDPRLILLPADPARPAASGPAAARNRCLAAATGQWIAVLDNDDLMHPQRLASLHAAALADGVDIAADDLLAFGDAQYTPRACLHGRAARSPFDVTAAAYVRANTLYRRRTPLGYLKPLIRSARLGSLRYDERLRIGEDYHLIARLLADGARMRVYPQLTYFYRRHAGSISHRLRPADTDALAAADTRFAAACAPAIAGDPALAGALAERARMLQRAQHFATLVAALQRRDFAAGLRIALRAPAAAMLLRLPLASALHRAVHHALPTRGAPTGRPDQAVVISRQRVTGPGSGSGAYLLDLADGLRTAGLTPHLVWPSPAMFGRWPLLRLDPAMAVFATVQARGGLRVGRHIMATTPAPWLRAARGAIGTALARAGLPIAALTRPAPYAIAAPWTRADQMFLATHARPLGGLIMADYAFQTPAIAYVLRPESPSLVVMHDLFSSRAAQFSRIGQADSVANIDLGAELRLLALADAVIAIQPEEAAIVQRALPRQPVLLAPIAVCPVAHPQPGVGHDVLFVGSKTAPNVIGLRGFLDDAWPTIQARVPSARLLIAGGVGSTVGALPPGATALGQVADLAPLYRDAAVIIAPLPAGSGLKIKVIEALGHGKAIVASAAALQGVAAPAIAAICAADTPQATIDAVCTLLTDPAARAEAATAALAAANLCYTRTASHAALHAYIAARLQTLPLASERHAGSFSQDGTMQGPCTPISPHLPYTTGPATVAASASSCVLSAATQ